MISEIDHDRIPNFLKRFEKELHIASFLKIFLLAVGGSYLVSTIFLYFYCMEYTIPFFDALDNVSKYIFYINAYVMFWGIIFCLPIILPAINRMSFDKDYIDREVF